MSELGKKLSLIGLGSAALYVAATWLQKTPTLAIEQRPSEKEQNFCWDFERTTPQNPDESTKIIARQGNLENEMQVEMVEGVAFPSFLSSKKLNKLKNKFQFLDGDVVICSHPQSGTKYVEKLIKLLLKTNNDSIWTDKIDFNDVVEEHKIEIIENYNENQKERRILRSHLPWDFFHGKLRGIIPENIKVVYVCDNPRDVCINQYTSSLVSEEGSPETKGWRFDAFSQAWLSGHVPFGGWFDHIMGWEEASDMNDVLWCFRGDFRTTFDGELKRLAEFLNVDLTTESEKEIKTKISERKRDRNQWKNFFSKVLHRQFVEFVRDQMEESAIREFAF